MNRPLTGLGLAALMAAACGTGELHPVTIDLGRDTCSHCRMAIVSPSTAAELLAPGEEPRIFDDLGCLRDFVAATPLPPEAVVWVADHRTGEWVDARRATFTSTAVATPMGSGLLAHMDAASRDRDRAAQGGTPVAIGSILP